MFAFARSGVQVLGAPPDVPMGAPDAAVRLSTAHPIEHASGAQASKKCGFRKEVPCKGYMLQHALAVPCGFMNTHVFVVSVQYGSFCGLTRVHAYQLCLRWLAWCFFSVGLNSMQL